MNSKISRSIATALLSLFLLMTIGFQPVYAIDKSRVFTCLLFLSGVGSSVAGAIMKDQANEVYDDYMHTADERDMGKLIDDYEQKNDQSTIASRVGLGLVISAALLSLVDAAYMPKPDDQEPAPSFGVGSKPIGSDTANVQTKNGDIFLSIRGKL